tara:strand:+ start:3634 stop:4572 length:939 start_codon:yes stop_codon:yes gene_type:complete
MTDIKKFYNVSEEIGNNYSLIQGAGGNTSLKHGEYISIKKSGSNLSEANKNDIFSSKKLNDLKNFYNKETQNKKYSNELSIETPLHIIFPEKYVFHYHSLLSIIISVGQHKDEVQKICERLNISWIPYKRPGVELAKQVDITLPSSDNHIFFLQNHGMLLGTNDIDEVSSTIKRLEHSFLKVLGLTNSFCKINLNYSGLSNDSLHSYGVTGTANLENLELINDKFLFPDHAVFGNYKYFSRDKVTSFKEKEIYWKDNYLLSAEEISAAELEILRSVVIITTYIKKVYNFIDVKTALNLISSEDEKYRVEKNK